MMKEGAVRKAGQPFSIMSRTIWSCWVWGSSCGRVVRSKAGGARMMDSPAALGFWITMELYKGPVNDVKPSQRETRHCTPRRYIYVSGMGGESALSSWSILYKKCGGEKNHKQSIKHII